MYRGGSRSLLITPKLEVPSVVFGFEKCAALNRLKKFASNLNCRRSEPRAVDLAREKSQLLIPGPKTWPTPELPNWKAGGAVKQLVSNHMLTVLGMCTCP